MRKVVVCAAIAVMVTAGLGLSGIDAADDPLASMVKAQYTDEGKLIRPTDFRKWIFVGASLGLSYGKEPARTSTFHHIYIQPEAYDHYVETGEFPEQTMFIMENYSAGSKEDNTAAGVVEGEETFENLHGHFEDKRVGLEVALKDSARFEDGWAYFNFSTRADLMEIAGPFPKAACWNCHNSHGADDNVFVQFYPVLRIPLEERLKSTKSD